ncbi:MAG: YkgJ family cysteine cluster protein [Candidatus Hodarchaeales archaeon]
MTKKIVDGQICRENNCHECCVETEMLLTKHDINRIATSTSILAKDFTLLNEDGYRMLKNSQKDNELQCYFLDKYGLCSIYEIKPEGCQFYPFIWDLTEHELIVDDYCPHYREFRKSPCISKKLEDFIYRLFGKI